MAAGAWEISTLAWVGVWVVALVIAVGVMVFAARVVNKFAPAPNPERMKKGPIALYREYPVVAELLKKGWVIGSHPDTAARERGLDHYR